MIDLLRSDFARLAHFRQREGLGFLLDCLLFDNGFQAVCGHRLASTLKGIGVPVLPSLLWRWTIMVSGVDINPRARFGPGLVISHGVGLVVGGDVVVGDDCLIHHQVTLGAPTVGRIEQNPKTVFHAVLSGGQLDTHSFGTECVRVELTDRAAGADHLARLLGVDPARADAWPHAGAAWGWRSRAAT